MIEKEEEVFYSNIQYCLGDAALVFSVSMLGPNGARSGNTIGHAG